jgi:hypothetical protein
MAIIAKASGESSQRELIPAGTYLARCYSMVHLGTVKQTYLGEEKWANLVRITWELPTELKCFNVDKGEQPCVISKEVTLSMNEKSTLRALLTGWRGKAFTEEEAREFDVSKLIGKPCMLSIFHQPSKSNPDKVYERIASISPVMKGMICPDQINPSFEFSVAEYDQAKFDTMPEFMKEMVRGSKEYQALLSKPAPKPAAPVAAPVATGYEQKVNQVVTNSAEEADELPF